MSLPKGHLGDHSNLTFPSSDPNHMQSTLEKGQKGNEQDLREIAGECDFHIKYIDISKNGTLGAPRHLLLKPELDALIDASPQGVLRLIIAQRLKSGLANHHESNLEKSFFRQSRRFPPFDHQTSVFKRPLWSSHDPALFRQCLRFHLQHRSVCFYDYFDSWAAIKTDQTMMRNEVSFLWLNDSPEHLVGVYTSSKV